VCASIQARASATFEETCMTQATDSKKWKDMNIGQKLLFLGKLVIFVASFGFAYPLLLSE
jgi:hypothetical protein